MRTRTSLGPGAALAAWLARVGSRAKVREAIAAERSKREAA
jgi:hypothetical protein